MCVAARVWVMELCRAMQTVAVKDGRDKTDKQIDRQTVGWAGRKAGRQAGRLAGWQTGMPVGLGLLHANTMTKAVCMCVCVCAYLCMCAASQKLIRQSEIEYCSCKMVKCFFAQQQVLPVPLVSLFLSLFPSSRPAGCRWRVIFVFSALFFGHVFLVFRNYASFI